jgi:three-Cys-motif partner protein
MPHEHQFGGTWTEQKLAKLKGYLQAYGLAFSGLSTRNFTTYYVDAFAGTGSRTEKTAGPSESLFSELDEQDVTEFRKGSARIALDVNPGFQRFVFIEQNRRRATELENLKSDYPAKASRISIIKGEANSSLQEWCKGIDWIRSRAVVFLDPYGMQVEWSLLQTLAKTKAIDLWLLFPLGTGVMRVLKKSEPPPEEWSNRLTKIFGCDEWKQRFYKTEYETDLFGVSSTPQRQANYKQVADYVVERLGTIFHSVQKTPYLLYNSKNCPLYLLTFAVGNEKGAPIAMKIANHLLKD